MDIKNFFSRFIPADNNKNMLHTPYGDFNLARESDRKQVNKIIIDLQRTTDALTQKDIRDWKRAWQRAINVENPSRDALYDIYRYVDIDSHLSGCVTQREGFVMARSFKIVDTQGVVQEEAMHYFDQAWFKQFCRLVLSSVYWGHAVIEIDDIITDGDGCICYSGVNLIPRKHVVSEYGRIVVNASDSWQSGIDYRVPPYSDWLIEAGQPDDLGLYLKAALHTIPKKNVLAFWDTFSEIFGMPMRVARTTSRDEKEKERLNRMLIESGASLSMVTDISTEIEFIETGKSDSYNVYDRRVDRANSELSKLIIGQTMTIEDGSSLSQSQTHLKVFENLVDSDCDALRDVINNQLIPRMVKHGFPLKGLRFEWDCSVDYTPEQQVAYETMIADRYEVAPEYFAEKYSMPVGERRNISPLQEPDQAGAKPADGENKDKKMKSLKPVKPFFD